MPPCQHRPQSFNNMYFFGARHYYWLPYPLRYIQPEMIDALLGILAADPVADIVIVYQPNKRGVQVLSPRRQHF